MRQKRNRYFPARKAGYSGDKIAVYCGFVYSRWKAARFVC